MFQKLMIPVDLAHLTKLRRAIDCAALLARTFEAPLIFVGVTTDVPGAVAHTPEEYAGKLAALAASEGETHGIQAQSHMIVSQDLAIDLDHDLIRAVGALGIDLVIMASHVPGLREYVWPSNGGRLASHASVSVMLVRGEN